ncbi:uncharacterized protein LOC127800104 isoform X1 [Diospyros lotus]|uniref:uncharacterized protein LOC127800104 isoform X1 n=1 Tax=Diospyros lotus TaxID=55363 RepID=UPI002259FD02|nr:uncharacterized protein LOC127800104 isoform X1 [Diospyros lotus]
MEGEEGNWSEVVEDLVNAGEVDKAISLLESVVSKLETLNSSQLDTLQLSCAIFDLAKLYSAKGFSLKADEARSRALLVRERYDGTRSPLRDLGTAKEDFGQNCTPYEASACDGFPNDHGERHPEKSSVLPDNSLPREESLDNDWEAIADCAPEDLLSSQCLPEVSKLSLQDNKAQNPKRRGRGKFSYTSDGLYSDQQSYGSVIESLENEALSHNPEGDSSEKSCSAEGDTQTRNLKYGVSHALVLADFPPSTKTADLEKLLENFKNQGFVIRWINDTTALAVFRTQKIALEACNRIQCTFTVRVLEEEDVLLKSIPPRDLDPPRIRPETSTSTARRLIAQGMGIKLPSTNFGSKELRKQEEARRNRIVSRQNMRDDAWGDD